MPYVHHDDDDAEADDDMFDDHDDPLESDMDDSDDPELIPCPYCKKPITEEAEICPHCHNYVSFDEPRYGPRGGSSSRRLHCSRPRRSGSFTACSSGDFSQ